MFFAALGAEDAIDKVGCAASGFVVVADLHFAEEADGQHVEAGEKQNRGENHQRAVIGDGVGVVEQLVNHQPGCNATAAEDAQHSDAAEEMQRAGEVAQQKADGHQVEEDPESARDAIVRIPVLAVDVADGDFANRGAVPRRESGNETVQFAVKGDLLQNLAPIGFESRAEVMDIHAAEFGHQPICTARGKAAQPEIVDAAFAPSADDVIALGNFFQEQRYVGGIVLQVAIHGDDVVAAGMIEAGGESGGLPKVAAQADDRDAAIDRGNFTQHVEGTVAGAVIDKDDFKAGAMGLHDGLEAIVQIGDILLLIVQGHNDGILGHGRSYYTGSIKDLAGYGRTDQKLNHWGDGEARRREREARTIIGSYSFCRDFGVHFVERSSQLGVRGARSKMDRLLIMFASLLVTLTGLNFIELRKIRKKITGK